MSNMPVKDWMTPHPVCCAPEQSVQTAVDMMAAHDIGSVIITHADGRLAGIFTERDLMNRVVAQRLDPVVTALRHVMTADPETADEQDDILKTYRRLLESKFRHLPVVCRGYPVGIISIRTPHLADLLIVAEYHLGHDSSEHAIQRVVGMDFEDELSEYVRRQFGTKIFREYRGLGQLDVLKDRLRDEFRMVYRQRTASRTVPSPAPRER